MKSRFEHLKAEVLEAFKSGATLAQVVARFGIPKSTASVWRDSLKSPERKPEQPEQPERKPDKRETRRPTSNRNDLNTGDLILIDGAAKKSDFAIVRAMAREITEDKKQHPLNRIAAGKVIIQLIQLRNNLPQHILDETEKSDLNKNIEELDKLDAAELARIYKEEIA